MEELKEGEVAEKEEKEVKQPKVNWKEKRQGKKGDKEPEEAKKGVVSKEIPQKKNQFRFKQRKISEDIMEDTAQTQVTEVSIDIAHTEETRTVQSSTEYEEVKQTEILSLSVVEIHREDV